MTTALARDIQRHCTSLETEMLDLLTRLVNTESPSENKDAQTAIFTILIEYLENLGYITFQFAGQMSGGFIVSRPKDRKKHAPFQLLIGHCDTVWPVGTLETRQLSSAAGKLSGPGVYDMKAGLTQIVFALKTLHDLKIETDVTPVVLINSDEEIGSRDSQCAITRLARAANRAYVMEPPLGPEGKLKTARKGLGRFTITITGTPAHAGLDPGKGASAILELSHQIQRLFSLNDHKRGITVNVGMIEGGVSPNVIAPQSRAVIDVRVLKPQDAEHIANQIYALKPCDPMTRLSIKGSFGRPPMLATPRNRTLWKSAKYAGKVMGLSLEEATAGGGSDGNTTSLYCATLDGLGTVGDGAHAEHEFILQEKLIERTSLLALLMLLPPLAEQ